MHIYSFKLATAETQKVPSYIKQGINKITFAKTEFKHKNLQASSGKCQRHECMSQLYYNEITQNSGFRGEIIKFSHDTIVS